MSSDGRPRGNKGKADRTGYHFTYSKYQPCVRAQRIALVALGLVLLGPSRLAQDCCYSRLWRRKRESNV